MSHLLRLKKLYIFENTQLETFLKLKSALDLPKISIDNHTTLRSFQQYLKSLITWYESMGDISSVDSFENISKAFTRLSKNLKSQLYRDFKENTFNNCQIKLKDFVKKINKFFNPKVAIVEHQEKHLRTYQRNSQI